MSNFKGSKDQLDECQPSDEFLFGSKLKELAKALKDQAQFSGWSDFRGKNTNQPKGGKKDFYKADRSGDMPSYRKNSKGGQFPKKKQ